MGRLDPETGKIDEFKTPGLDIPRRMGADWEGNLWIGFHEASQLVKVDQKTGKMTHYSPPTPNNGAYHVVTDAKHKVIWLTEQTADKIARFDPKTETWTEFSLPIVESDARRIELDPTNPGGGWIPTIVITNHGVRGLKDATPYDHYSLLRTTEDASGLLGPVRGELPGQGG